MKSCVPDLAALFTCTALLVALSLAPVAVRPAFAQCTMMGGAGHGAAAHSPDAAHATGKDKKLQQQNAETAKVASVKAAKANPFSLLEDCDM